MNYTLDDIARELGMSKTTVSRAISGKGRISEATRLKVAEFTKSINYTPSAVARGLATNKTFNLGLVFSQDSSLNEIPFFRDILMGVSETALGFDYDTLIILADNNDISALQRSVENKKVDGIIVTSCVKDSRVIAYLKDVGMPYIVIGNPMDEEVLYVDNDNCYAAQRMMEALASQKMRNFALIGGNDTLYVTQSRLEGYREGIVQSNLKVDESLIYLNMHKSERLGAAIRNILDHDVDCIVCMDDVLCNSTLVYLQTIGVSVPRDVKLVSFYDSKLLSNHKPSITSLSFDSKYLGRQAVELMMRNIDGNDAQSMVNSNYNLQMRDSTR